MKFPCSTGEGARFLGVTEPQLAETVRRGKVDPEPPVVAGRRLWSPGQLRQAAVALDLLTEEVEVQLEIRNESTDKEERR